MIFYVGLSNLRDVMQSLKSDHVNIANICLRKVYRRDFVNMLKINAVSF